MVLHEWIWNNWLLNDLIALRNFTFLNFVSKKALNVQNSCILTFIWPLCVLVIQSAKLLISYCVWKLLWPTSGDTAGRPPLLSICRGCFNDHALSRHAQAESLVLSENRIIYSISTFHAANLLFWNGSKQCLFQIMSS